MPNVKQRLILHCGLPKTGTTALQLWLYRHLDAMLEAGIVYPGPYSDRVKKQTYLVSALRKADGIQEIAWRLSDIQAPTVVLSNEGLANHLYDFDPETLGAFRKLTRDRETTIIFLTRQKDTWLRSRYRQSVLNPPNGASELHGTSLTFEEIKDHPRVRAQLDHDRLSQDLIAALGAQRLVKLDYDNPGWFQAFLTELGVPHLADQPLSRINQSVPDWVIEILRQANAQSRDIRSWRAWRQAVQRQLKTDSISLLDASNGPSERLDPTAVEKIIPALDWSASELKAFARFKESVCHKAVPRSESFPAQNQCPRKIWMLWLQGWDQPPKVVQASRASWQRSNPGWDLQLLGRDSLADVLPAATLEAIFGKPMTPNAQANLVRLELLHRYGGVWADATTLCVTPLDSWLPNAMNSGFFTFAHPTPDRMLVNWFLVAVPESYIIAKWREATWAYWEGRTQSHIYFWMHELFADLYKQDETFRNIWDATPKISAKHRFHFAPDAPALFKAVPAEIELLLAAPPAPVFKLTHKLSSKPGRESLFAYLCAFGGAGRYAREDNGP